METSHTERVRQRERALLQQATDASGRSQAERAGFYGLSPAGVGCDWIVHTDFTARGRHAVSAGRLSDGQVVLRIGCHVRLLSDWRDHAEALTRGSSSTPELLRALCTLVELELCTRGEWAIDRRVEQMVASGRAQPTPTTEPTE